MSEDAAPAARSAKGAGAFRTIGEVAEDLDLPTHVLRFWESKFPQLKPLKRTGGRRYYRPEDILLLRRIRQCLYQEGYTIRGVQQLLGAPTGGAAPAPATAAAPSLFPIDAPVGLAPPEPKPARRRRQLQPQLAPRDEPDVQALEEIRRVLGEARALLDTLLHPPKPP